MFLYLRFWQSVVYKMALTRVVCTIEVQLLIDSSLVEYIRKDSSHKHDDTYMYIVAL